MIRKLLSILAVGSAAVAAQPGPPRADASKILPYVVPAAYLDFQRVDAKPLMWPLGNGLHVVLVHDLEGLVGNVLPEELAALGLTIEQAKKKAIENLEALAKSGAIGQRRFEGPNQKPFVLFGGHWAAATCILLPELREIGVRNLGSKEVCVCIPHREALLLFPKGDREYREVMLKMIRQRESDGEKPLTFDLFELTEGGVIELKE
jgi:hypothetical protein